MPAGKFRASGLVRFGPQDYFFGLPLPLGPQ